MKKIIAYGIIMVVLVPWQAHGGENELNEIVNFFNSSAGRAWSDRRPILETEAEQVGLEWGRLLTQRVLKKFEEQTGEKLLR